MDLLATHAEETEVAGDPTHEHVTEVPGRECDSEADAADDEGRQEVAQYPRNTPAIALGSK